MPLYGDRLERPVDRFMAHVRPGHIAMRLNWSVMDDPTLFQPAGKWRTEHDVTITETKRRRAVVPACRAPDAPPVARERRGPVWHSRARLSVGQGGDAARRRGCSRLGGAGVARGDGALQKSANVSGRAAGLAGSPRGVVTCGRPGTGGPARPQFHFQCRRAAPGPHASGARLPPVHLCRSFCCRFRWRRTRCPDLAPVSARRTSGFFDPARLIPLVAGPVDPCPRRFLPDHRASLAGRCAHDQ